MVQLSTSWVTPNWGMPPPVRRFLSNYFDLLLMYGRLKARLQRWNTRVTNRLHGVFHFNCVNICLRCISTSQWNSCNICLVVSSEFNQLPGECVSTELLGWLCVAHVTVGFTSCDVMPVVYVCLCSWCSSCDYMTRLLSVARRRQCRQTALVYEAV